MKKLYNILKRESDIFLRDFVVNGWASSNLTPKPIRIMIYKMYGIDLKSYGIRGGCFFGRPRVSIGKDTFINYNCFFEATNKITIGNNCAVAMGVTFCNSNHDTNNPSRRAGEVESQPITVGNGVWIGANSTILPGVIIGDGCVIAAGAVVANDCEPNGIYGGVPAKKIKNLNSSGFKEVGIKPSELK